MFQLFRQSGTYLERTRPLSIRSLSENTRINLRDKTCLLCKLLNVNARLQIRHESTLRSNWNKTQTKRSKKKNKSYSDILEVTDASSKVKKAKIIKLTAVDLNVLASSNVALNELYKIKNKKFVPQTYSDLNVEGVSTFESDLIHQSIIPTTLLPSVVPKPQTEETEENEPESLTSEELDIQSRSVRDCLQPELIEEAFEEVIIQPQPLKKIKAQKIKICPEKMHHLMEHRSTIAQKTLAAYIEVCNHQRNPHRGLAALYFHHSRARLASTKLSTVNSVNVYSTLLKGFANKGDYPKLNLVLQKMKDQNVQCDLNCYAAIFECLGRINVQNHYQKDIRVFANKAFAQNINFNDIMQSGVFFNDERIFVLKAFRAYDSSYTPQFKEPQVFYKNHLVDHLNHKKLLHVNELQSKGSGELTTVNRMNEQVQKQLALEDHGYITIKSIENKGEPSQDVKNNRHILDEHYEYWTEEAKKGLQRDLATLAAHRTPFNLEPYLRSIPQKDMVEIIVQEAKKLAQGSETYSPELSLLYKLLGHKVYARYRIVRKQKTGVLEKTLQIHTKYCHNYAVSHTELSNLPSKPDLTNPRIEWQMLEHQLVNQGATLDMGHQPWVPTTFSNIGKFLYNIIVHDLKVDVNSLKPNTQHKNYFPAFYTIVKSQGHLTKEEIKPHPVLSKLHRQAQSEFLTFPANEVPMLCPPVPWTSISNGSYLISPTEVVRLPFQASTQKQRLKNASAQQLYPNFDALNQLSSVPWKVNKKILDVILEVFRNGGNAKLDVPESPASLPLPPLFTPDMDKTAKFEVFKQKLQYRRQKGEMYSLWCDCLYRLSLANHFRDDIFWLPHNMDFRGRVYPVPPHLSHLGSDLARSMLVFAESRPLGPKGLDWLKIHLINLTGLKKRDSVQDRLKYANDLIGLILDSADNPLNGEKWWTQSDEPWQTLACCMEIADVMRSGIAPAFYKSHFPVHQDGSCNGLQHYAALGRDSSGAYSVNLAPCDVPQDVYSAVVNLVEEQRAKDEAEGNEIAKILNGFVKRKVIKQTIMTTVYGVTRFGARLQIAKQLKDIDDFPKESVWAASSYLTGKTFESLRTMFTSTREIQDWFTECARLISGTSGSLVEWVTPLGLPVVQPYIKYKKMAMPQGYEGFMLDQYEKPNMMKQKNAFPPNFIHSLDSSHMMLTSLHCQRAGITFVSVHDCYWTHPSTIHIMNKICREQFVALHSEPILEDLSIFLYDLFAYDESQLGDDKTALELSKKRLNRVLKQLPKTGDFDIRNVLNSIYFFS